MKKEKNEVKPIDTEFKTGDIFIQETGGRGSEDGWEIHYKLFEYRENNNYGLGFQYSRAGKLFSHYWAYPKKENYFSPIPEDILFSFKHGSCGFYINEKLVNKVDSIEQLIRSSDFKFITQEEIDVAKVIENINNLQEIKSNWNVIKANGCNDLIARICLEDMGIKIPEVYNGEIGIHSFNLISTFWSLIDEIEKHLCISV